MIKITPYNLSFKSKTSKTPPHAKNSVISHTDSKGDVYEVCYKNGKLNRSYKNGELYKTYYYKGSNQDDITNEYFSDDSYIPIKHLWHVDNKDIRSVVDHEQNKEHFFLRNDKNGIQNEPKLFAHITLDSKNQIEKRNIVRFDDRENIKFSSVEQARKYFLEEYGIDAEFNDIFQATVFKQAVDAFEPFNYENKGKRLFEGLIVRNDADAFLDDEEDTFATVSCISVIDTPDKIREAGDSEYYQYIQNHPECVSFENAKMLLNPDIKYDSMKFAKEKAVNACSYRFFSGVLIHELAHWLHLNNSPAEFFLSDYIEFEEDEKEIVKEVSEYSIIDSAEFVAEYIAGRLEGRKFSKEADELYSLVRGPELFDN